jgi:hypothetical protein
MCKEFVVPHYKFNLVCLFIALALAASGSLTARAQSPDFSEPWVEEPAYFGYEQPPTPAIFAVNAELLWLNRTEANPDQTLVTRNVDVTINGLVVNITSEMIRMGDLNLPTEAGIRFSVLLGPSTGRYFELTYSGIFDQDATVQVAPNNATRTDLFFFGAGLTELTIFQDTATYESDFHSGELNVWSDQEAWRLRPFLGIRWIRQDEILQIYETQAPGDGGRADFVNNLFGVQGGFATVLWQRADWFNVQATVKTGVYRNEMDLDASANIGGVPSATLSRDLGVTSCSGQVDLTAIWQVTPYMNFHVGYTGLWLTEVGLVGDQNASFDILTGTGEIDTGTVSYQGGHLGVTVTW